MPPTSSTKDDTPRSASRIFNSLIVQEQFRASGRTTSEDTGERYRLPKGKRRLPLLPVPPLSSKRDEDTSRPKKSKKRKLEPDTGSNEKREPIEGIRPGETLGEYNRRVESILRPGLTRAIRAAKLKSSSSSSKPSNHPQSSIETETQLDPRSAVKIEVEKTFAPIPAPRRLNDVVQSPPILPHLRRSGMKKEESGFGVSGATGRTPLSLGQMRILEEERERVVKRYREIKEARAGVREGKVERGENKGESLGTKRKIASYEA